MLDICYRVVWGWPLLLLILGVGLYLTIVLRGIQLRYLGYGLKLAFGGGQRNEGAGDVSHFQSLMTALAATIGIGNIAGVATALVSGGLGALFWMWITAFIGMAIKYAEAILAIRYREVDARGGMAGGPMYFIGRGLGWRWLAISFAVCGALAALGGGNMLQANSVADVMEGVFGVAPTWTAVGLAVMTACTILGGIKSIGRVASWCVPLMAIVYIGGALCVLLLCWERIPEALGRILSHAFTGQAAFGGFMGATVAQAIQVGVSRGLMTSEAGLGTASIAAAAAKTDVPGRQALVSMTGSFLATIVMCTMTGLVLGVTDVFGQEGLNGASLTVAAFRSVLPWGEYVVSIGLIFFAFTTLIGWAYYGEKCVEYVCGGRSIGWYRVLFIAFVALGALLELEVVWKVSDICNGLMAFPNLVGVLFLTPVVVQETRTFLALLEGEKSAQSVRS